MVQQGRQPLTDYLRVQMSTDSELRRVLELAARQSSAKVRALDVGEGTGFADRVRVAQYQQVVADVGRIQSEMWVDGVGPIIQRNYSKAQAAATRSFGVVERELIRKGGDRVAAESIVKGAQQTVRNGLELDRVRRSRHLSPTVYKNAALQSGAVERTIRAGIIQGLSAKELAANVSKYISPRTPGGAAYAALRLARTELNNAFHEAQILQAQSASWVKAVKWNLSGSHPTGKPDDCDKFARQNDFRLGAGHYPVDQVPDKPHPQCLCYTTVETISESEMLDFVLNRANRRIA